MNAIVVIPSIRGIDERFLEPIPSDVPILVVDDSNGRIAKTGYDRKVLVFTDEDQVQYDPHAYLAVAHRNPACKAFGYCYARREGFDVIISLDDDVDLRQFPDYYEQIVLGKPVETSVISATCGWFNTCAMLHPLFSDIPSLTARGIPYEVRDGLLDLVLSRHTITPIFNEGLWTGQPDVCGVDKIGIETFGDYSLVSERVALAPKTNLPLSIMNVQFMANLVPAFYQPPDYPMPNGFRIRRHDDVWSMYVLKAIIDFVGLGYVTVGAPMGTHVKKGDLLTEIKSEHYTNLAQGWFQKVVDVSIRSCDKSDAGLISTTRELALNMQHFSRAMGLPRLFADVIYQYAEGMLKWLGLFDAGINS